jgi:hypothetical protein
MHKIPVLALIFLMVSSVPVVASAVMTLEISPDMPVIGERVYLQGKTSGEHTIAIYLMLSGPGLDRRGVTLENINLPAGQGYFTSAHVSPDGSWMYEWDTAFIAGTLEPVTYTVHAVEVPVNLQRITDERIVSQKLTFIQPVTTPALASQGLFGIIPVSFLVVMLFMRSRRRILS